VSQSGREIEQNVQLLGIAQNEEQLKEWRQKRRQGKIRVDLDHEFVDQAKRVLGIELVSTEN
jgi:hypothetical protein